MTQISFNPQAVGTAAANDEGSDMGPPGGDNALPFVVRASADPNASVEVFTLPYVESRELVRPDLPTEDVDTAPGMVGHASRVNLKLVDSPTGSLPSNEARRGR